ncbi:MAG: proteobacterial dedicated sortase system histidine kinase [Exilibacterium sp.]
MKLRRQLIIVSLLTLCLPWAGCQYIREMEGALRQGQVVAIAASAQAVAARLANEASLRADLARATEAGPSQPSATPSNQIYLHPLPGAAIVDGYSDDWRDLDFHAVQLPALHSGLAVSYRAGIYNNDVFLFLEVTDPVLTYHNPSLARMASGDHLVHGTGTGTRQYIIRTSAPGDVTGRYVNQRGLIRQEHRVHGVWLETKRGYQLELRLPRQLLDGRLGFAVVNIDDVRKPVSEYSGTLVEPNGAPPPYVTPQKTLTEAIEIFAGEGLRLRLASTDQWLLAEAGQLEQPNPLRQQQHGLLTWLYRAALGKRHFPPLDQPQQTGHFDAGEVQQALRGHSDTRWYRDGPRRVGRATVPIEYDRQVIGAVVAEQSSDTLLALTNQAFNRLFFYTLLATAVAGVGLLAYASWLSWRIRRLSRAADTAISEDGKILGHFPGSRARDEVGDLARSYSQLLARLKEYTEYLKTLSSKLSHELRTPLAVVRSSLDNLEHERLQEQAQVYVERAREGASRLSGILTAMSAASRVEQSIKGAEMELFPLDQLLREVTAAYKDIYPQQLRLTTPGTDSDYTVFGSPELIVQMLDKLVDNAADFCPADGYIQLSLAQAQREICLRVSNDGPLLPQRMQGQLFDSLVSIRDRKNAPDGAKTGPEKAHLGLGLHIVRLIVDCHNGRVSARNRRDGSGVTFEIVLPSGTSLS